ncbi:ribokinase [Granulimonas faecalis]|uniref:Ribokinase n=1 Tax=Granulimonas faecalis TaxID=2894155 RepID=A0AAV5B2T7_9ACTN|nr:ribokinase [Granulimonas faecalis]GJM54963.1 ribokinase [Granulimonas faecalis]
MPKALVFGSMNMDLSICCARIPAAGETIDGDSFITNPGGKGANQAVAASRMGAPVTMVAAVGDDTFGSVLLGCLDGAGIDVSAVRTVTEVPTGTATIIRVDGDNRIILDHGANYCLSSADVCDAVDRFGEPGDVFLTQFECEPDATAAALAHAHDRGLFTMVNPAPARPIPDDFWRSVDYLCMNETECESITGDFPFGPEDASMAARKIAGKGVSQVVVTLGSKGSYGYDRGEECFVPARCVDAVDTTAAGDTFIGAMVSGHLMGMGFRESMELATCASALTVQRVGAQQSIPSLAEVNASF